MTFLVHTPGHPLNLAVERFYCPLGAMPFAREHVMPGPAMDLKINFGEALSSKRSGSNQWEEQPSGGWAMGIWDAHHDVCWPGHVDFVGLTLRPGGSLALFGIEAHELSNAVVDIDCLLGPFAAELRGRLAEAPGARARFALLESLLTARLRATPELLRVAPALKLLRQANGMVSMTELAAASEVSHKHLIHLFNRVAGAPPKTMARLYRLEHLLATIDSEDPRTWTGTAHDFNYCDQAHFNKDFKKLTGQTPGRYLKHRRRAQAADPRHAEHWRLLPQG